MRVRLNLVDFYKVSLASRDGFSCHTDSTESTDFSRIAVLARGWRGFSYSPCPAGRDLVDLINLFLRDSLPGTGLD